jgi:hypothetical protein
MRDRYRTRQVISRQSVKLIIGKHNARYGNRDEICRFSTKCNEMFKGRGQSCHWPVDVQRKLFS